MGSLLEKSVMTTQGVLPAFLPRGEQSVIESGEGLLDDQSIEAEVFVDEPLQFEGVFAQLLGREAWDLGTGLHAPVDTGLDGGVVPEHFPLIFNYYKLSLPYQDPDGPLCQILKIECRSK